MLLLLTLMACQAPFDVNRHDLGPPRIAAMGVRDGAARAALWSGLGGWHDERPSLAWSLDGAPIGEGYDVAVPDEPGALLELRATVGGETLEGSVHLPAAAAPSSLVVSRSAVDIGADVSVATRAALEAVDVEAVVPAGLDARLRAQPSDGAAPDGTLRWMSAGGLGTLLELDEQTVDLLDEELTFDGAAVVEREDAGLGRFLLLSLQVDGEGGNAWRWFDVAFGEDPGLVRLQERILPAPDGAEAGCCEALRVTLVLADDIYGLGFADPEAVSDPQDQGEPLACGLPGADFQLDWIIEGRCTRDEVLGRRVVIR